MKRKKERERERERERGRDGDRVKTLLCVASEIKRHC